VTLLNILLTWNLSVHNFRKKLWMWFTCVDQSESLFTTLLS
jgi:hypothetical protein